MRLSLKWLSDYISLDVAPAEIASALDAAGFEVESMRRLDEGLAGVVVARVASVKPHPDADRLRVCSVEYGGETDAEVVCGAWNFDAGAVVAYAPAGTELPGGLILGRRKIRGVLSDGMICSEEELGLGGDAEGIMILAGSETPLAGTPIAEALSLDDVLIELDITPNRPDAMSMLGLAREAAAAFSTPYLRPEIVLNEAAPTSSESVSIENKARERCPRYTARVLDSVTVGPSPSWLVSKLAAAGIRSINNVVDITNFVLLETGQPLHAFDLDQITDSKIVVRTAEAGEEFRTLDGSDRVLGETDLVIADSTRPLALAGIMGGESSEIAQSTRRVLIESAYFDPKGILATSKRLGLRSESSSRFERGCDPEMAVWASDRAASLIADLAGGRVFTGIVDDYAAPIRPRQIDLRPARTNSILGTDLNADEQARHLESIELDVKSVTDTKISVVAPTFRPDLEREIDLIEEVGRLHGYDHVQLTLPASAARIGSLTRRQRQPRKLAQGLYAAGMSEAQTFSFVGPEDLLNGQASVSKVANPLRAEESVLRPSLLPGVIRSAEFNLSRRRADVRLFEMGRVFGPPDENGIPSETSRVAGVVAGDGDSDALGFLGVKGIVETVLEYMGVENVEFTPTERPGMHPGRTAQLTIGESPAGIVAELHPETTRRFGLGGRAGAFELDQSAIFDGIPPLELFSEISRFPLALVDIALIVDEPVPAGAVSAAIEAALGSELESCSLFDVYRGSQIGAGQKSLGFALGFSSLDHTLGDEEVAALRERAIDAARLECGAELRGG